MHHFDLTELKMLHKCKNPPSKDILLHYCGFDLFRIYRVELILCHIINCALVGSVGWHFGDLPVFLFISVGSWITRLISN